MLLACTVKHLMQIWKFHRNYFLIFTSPTAHPILKIFLDGKQIQTIDPATTSSITVGLL